MSLHNVYCNECNRSVNIFLPGRAHDFMDSVRNCPCEENNPLVLKDVFGNCRLYGLFNICDLVPSQKVVEEVRNKIKISLEFLE